MEFVKKLNRSLHTRKVQRVLDESPLILYYSVTGMKAEAYNNLKRLLHENGFECHLMCRNKCLPVHEDNLYTLQETTKAEASQKN